MRSPKDILALGRVIIEQLELNDRGTLLDRWLAHHVAELIAQADSNVGEAKLAAETRAVEVILKLWASRRSLPVHADPLGGFREAIAFLERLKPEENPWARLGWSGTQEGALRELFDTMSRIVVGGILLTASARGYSLSAEEEGALEADEQYLLAALKQWMVLVAVPQPPMVALRTVDPKSLDTKEHDGNAPSGDVTSGRDEPNPGEDPVRAAILENLERMHADLGKLLDRWRRLGRDKDVSGDGDG